MTPKISRGDGARTGRPRTMLDAEMEHRRAERAKEEAAAVAADERAFRDEVALRVVAQLYANASGDTDLWDLDNQAHAARFAFQQAALMVEERRKRDRLAETKARFTAEDLPAREDATGDFAVWIAGYRRRWRVVATEGDVFLVGAFDAKGFALMIWVDGDADGLRIMRRLEATERLLAEAREASTDLMICAGNARKAARRDLSWEGVAEKLDARCEKLNAAIARATGGDDAS